jgi:SAM-dependent methyltransferase
MSINRHELVVVAMLAAKIKKAIKRTPFVGDALLAVRRRGLPSYAFHRVDSRQGWSQEAVQALNVLNYTKTSGETYSATEHPAGYHTIEVGGQVLAGQRKPQHRLALAPFDFAGKRVLDIGSNQGGMLHALDGRLAWGVGLDFNPKLVNAATRIAAIRGDASLRFYHFDLERDPLDLIEDLIPDAEVDVVFLLSVCMWIKNWQAVIDKAASLTKHMLFETNGDEDVQDQQVAYLKTVFLDVRLLAGSSEDDPRQKSRRLLWCSHTLE